MYSTCTFSGEKGILLETLIHWAQYAINVFIAIYLHKVQVNYTYIYIFMGYFWNLSQNQQSIHVQKKAIVTFNTITLRHNTKGSPFKVNSIYPTTTTTVLPLLTVLYQHRHRNHLHYHLNNDGTLHLINYMYT